MTTPYDNSNPNAPTTTGVPAATVVTQDIPWDVQGTTNFIDPSTYNQGIFTDLTINFHFEKDPSIYMMGVASPGGFNGNTAAFVQLTNNRLLWIVDWTVCKAGSKPQIPNPASQDPNWVFLYELYEPVHVELDGTGDSTIYRISGCYVYGALNGNRSTTQYVYWPRPPWVDPSVDRSLDTSEIIGGLITSPNGTSTGSTNAGGPGFFVGPGG